MLRMTRYSILLQRARYQRRFLPVWRQYATQGQQKELASNTSSERTTSNVYDYKKPPARPPTKLAQYLKRSPRAMAIFETIMNALGARTPRQVGGQITLKYYDNLCAPRETEERNFWHDECHLPPTFQTWFTVTNLHVWLLTVRFRALPPPYGDSFVQGLVDHFFLDVEDRIRETLSRKAPERLVTRHMKILREQWMGLNFSLDMALGLSSPYLLPTVASSARRADGDAEMAATVWRNFLGARGAQGIDDPGQIRRNINITGEYDKPRLSRKNPEESLRTLEQTDDGSGVYDFVGKDVNLYVRYPELMYTLVKYIRRELARLDRIPDEGILNGEDIGRFGEVVEQLFNPVIEKVTPTYFS